MTDLSAFFAGSRAARGTYQYAINQLACAVRTLFRPVGKTFARLIGGSA